MSLCLLAAHLSPPYHCHQVQHHRSNVGKVRRHEPAKAEFARRLLLFHLFSIRLSPRVEAGSVFGNDDEGRFEAKIERSKWQGFGLLTTGVEKRSCCASAHRMSAGRWGSGLGCSSGSSSRTTCSCVGTSGTGGAARRKAMQGKVSPGRTAAATLRSPVLKPGARAASCRVTVECGGGNSWATRAASKGTRPIWHRLPRSHSKSSPPKRAADTCPLPDQPAQAGLDAE